MGCVRKSGANATSQDEPEIDDQHQNRQGPGQGVPFLDQLMIFRIALDLARGQFRHRTLLFVLLDIDPRPPAPVADLGVLGHLPDPPGCTCDVDRQPRSGGIPTAHAAAISPAAVRICARNPHSVVDLDQPQGHRCPIRLSKRVFRRRCDRCGQETRLDSENRPDREITEPYAPLRHGNAVPTLTRSSAAALREERVDALGGIGSAACCTPSPRRSARTRRGSVRSICS